MAAVAVAVVVVDRLADVDRFRPTQELLWLVSFQFTRTNICPQNASAQVLISCAHTHTQTDTERERQGQTVQGVWHMALAFDVGGSIDN